MRRSSLDGRCGLVSKYQWKETATWLIGGLVWNLSLLNTFLLHQGFGECESAHHLTLLGLQVNQAYPVFDGIYGTRTW